MLIKELIVEGFKSYGVRTSLGGFDKNFNAITGLNGSGKSNIFDAICFVMGISSLSHMRVSNLTELIYKNGKAGVKKASVTMKLANVDKSCGYIDDDEVEITRTIYEGKSKYYLNGITATQDKVKSFFLSANLNINNPHFLIMQGKVTKVVNMNVHDILGLIEEASGTGIYEIKKDSSLKTIKKKDIKLDEIEKYLNEVITPRLNDLQRERQVYLKWKDNDNKLRRMKKVIMAFRHFQLEKMIQNEKDEKEKAAKEIQQLHLKLVDIQSKKNELDLKIKLLEDKTTDLKNKDFLKLEDDIRQTSNNIKSAENKKINMKKSIEKSDEEKMKLENTINNLKQEQSYLEKKIFSLNNDLTLLEQDSEKKKEFLEQMEDQYKNNSRDGSGNNESMLKKIRNLVLEADNNIKKIGIEIKHISSQQEILQNKINNISQEKEFLNNSIKSNIKNQEQLIKDRDDTIKDIEYYTKKEGTLSDIKQRKLELELKMKDIDHDKETCKHKINEVLHHSRFFNLSYTDPERNFDRSKIKGRVIMLFNVSNQNYAKALDKIAGLRLFNIVVDTNETASLLFSRKCFRNSETLLPLNKINPFDFDANKKDLIQRTFGNSAIPAHETIKYDKVYDKIMRYVFGNTYICENNEVAKKLAYNKEFKVRCVNLDGDLFDPSGTMTGGSSGNYPSNILKADEVKQLENKIQFYDSEFQLLHKEFLICVDIINRLEEYMNKLNYINSELEASDEKLKKNKIDRLEKDKQVALDDIKINEERIAELENKIKNYKNELKQLQEDEKNLKSGKNSDSIIKAKINQIKLELNTVDDTISKKSKENVKLEANKASITKEILNLESNLKIEVESNLKSRHELAQYEESINRSKYQLQKFENELSNKRKEESIHIQELKTLNDEKESVDKLVVEYQDSYQLNKKKLEELELGRKNNIEEYHRISRENEWIDNEKQFFNMPDSDYDFNKINIEDEKKAHKELLEENKFLEKKVNFKVDMVFEDFEKQYEKLLEKKEILKNDKIKIQKTIIELDIKRKESLEQVYGFVNKKFNDIYSTFLPGASAKLQILEGKTLLDGLEMKVAFNNSWKNSLSELSGGQRSLLALSFILSLLCYKPAPFYILDEIDAALDLSHTSNLGVMIKEHFPQSQFIIISLKEGMFNNANVLYQISFSEGTSKVNRIVKELKNTNPIIKKK